MGEEEGVGRPFTMPIERGKIREFAAATKSVNPVYLEGERPMSPPTFLVSSAFWMQPENEPVGRRRNVARVLHGEQEFVFPGEPPRAGCVLTVQKRVESRYEREGRRGGKMMFTVFATEYRDEQGTVVAEVRNTVIETERPPVGVQE